MTTEGDSPPALTAWKNELSVRLRSELVGLARCLQSELVSLAQLQQQQLLDVVDSCLAHPLADSLDTCQLTQLFQSRVEGADPSQDIIPRKSVTSGTSPGGPAGEQLVEPSENVAEPDTEGKDATVTQRFGQVETGWEVSTSDGWKAYTLVDIQKMAIGESVLVTSHNVEYEVTRTSEREGVQKCFENDHVQALRVQKRRHPLARRSIAPLWVVMASSAAKNKLGNRWSAAHDRASRLLETMATVVILANTFVMIVNFEYQGWKLGVDLGIHREDLSWANAGDWFFAIEHFFTAFFLVELVINLYVKRLGFFKELLNLFDAFLVTVTCLEMYVIQPLEMASVGNVTMLRLSRTAKLARALRVVRTVEFFSSLRVLVKATASSLKSLVWSMLYLLGLMLVGGLLMVGLAAEYIEDPLNTVEKRIWAWQHYGTATRSTYTMYEITLSGCWPNYIRPIMEDGGLVYVIFFLVYVTFVVFAVIRIITAIFLKDTLDAASQDKDRIMREKEKTREANLIALDRLFQDADASGDGEITFEEFEEFITEPGVIQSFAELGLDIHEGTALFHLLDDGDGVITSEEFVQGVSRLKGQAKTVDVMALQVEMKRSLKQVANGLEDLLGKSSGPSGRRASARTTRRASVRANMQVKRRSVYDASAVPGTSRVEASTIPVVNNGDIPKSQPASFHGQRKAGGMVLL